jgi:hypothetical protein
MRAAAGAAAKRAAPEGDLGRRVPLAAPGGRRNALTLFIFQGSCNLRTVAVST